MKNAIKNLKTSFGVGYFFFQLSAYIYDVKLTKIPQSFTTIMTIFWSKVTDLGPGPISGLAYYFQHGYIW